ncbi:MAG: isoleucine--tRNA ligase, partial [Paludibacteraceae bacterium]|nr:isoleucine--tRNA ligase [Paludibacteraceae bacterium]
VVIKSANPYTGAEATYIMAKALVSNYFGPKKAEPFEIVGECKGPDLVGIEYEQLIPWVNPGEGAFRVIPGDYVTTEDGTGIVHIAPTFGADDAFVAKKAGVPGLSFPTKKGELRPMVDMTGKFFLLSDIDDEFVKNNINTELYKEFEGRFVKNAYDPNLTDKDETLDISICMMLKQQGKAFKIEKHVHNYPHCWRTDKPVLYYPLDSWFIKTTACRDRMIELNKTINWKPESTGTGRFGKWLENLQDWNLSRSRYWGTPLPIWRTDDGSEEICIGSMEELMAEIEKSVAAGVMSENPYKHFKVGDFSKENYAPENIDLHRPYIDSIILVSKDGKPMKRETDLIDVWFDSGSMPYAQLHYPFENKELIDTRSYYPADFISEGVDQTRGWFFTLHAIATMVFDSVAFKNVISNGLVLDKNGNKMSKRLGNAVDPFGAIEKYGSDPLRWYMMTNSAPWDNLKFDEEGVEEISRKFFGTLYNTYSFFALYANVDGFTYAEPDVPTEERQEIDRWILSLLNTLTREVQDALESYEPTRAGRAIQDFVTENLSNWYVRLNRKRFWAGKMDKDKLSAYQTLYTCLETVSLLMAPIAPFYADRIFRDLNAATGRHNVESVHLATFPKYNEAMVNKRLEEQMELAQKLTSLTLALRKKADIKVRQPLSHVMIPTTVQNIKENLESVADLIKAEVNVKEIKTVEGSDGILVKRIKPDFKKLGPKCGKAMKSVAATLQALPQEEIRKFEENGVYTLCIDGNNIEVSTADVEIFSEDIPGWLVANDGNLTIALDITVTEELRQEGLARELVNRIQNMRKQSGLNITDKINITVCADAEYCRAIEAFAEYIKQQVLGLSITTADTLEGAQEWDVDGKKISVKIEKA